LIALQKDGGFWQVTLNRTGKANALNKAMLTELLGIVQRANGSATVLAITGSGKVFSAGADLVEVGEGLATDDIWEELSLAIATLPCLTIAALNGALAGGAFGIALACDLRICVEDAKMFYPALRLGVLPQPSDPQRLQQLVGPSRAKMILVAGQTIDAKTALDWGLVDAVVPNSELQKKTRELSQAALQAKAGHAAKVKQMFAPAQGPKN